MNKTNGNEQIPKWLNQSRSALHLAAKKGNEVIVDLLLKNGANINHVNEFGKTALHRAIEYGKQLIISMIHPRNQSSGNFDSLKIKSRWWICFLKMAPMSTLATIMGAHQYIWLQEMEIKTSFKCWFPKVLMSTWLMIPKRLHWQGPGKEVHDFIHVTFFQIEHKIVGWTRYQIIFCRLYTFFLNR